MNPIPGVELQVIGNPSRYTWAQLELAIRVAAYLNRGLFVLLQAPER